MQKTNRLCLQELSEYDSQAIWQWRNDPITRAMSLNTDYIDWDSHTLWFSKVLANPCQFAYLAKYTASQNVIQKQVSTDKVAIVRFDTNGDDLSLDKVSTKKGVNVLVSINVNPEYRGFGLAKEAVFAAINTFLSEVENRVDINNKYDLMFEAQIKVENKASIALFRSCGFVLSDHTLNQVSKHSNSKLNDLSNGAFVMYASAKTFL